MRYGLDHPAFYALLYPRVAPRRPCRVTAVAERQLRSLLEHFDGRGVLRTTPEAAAQQIVAATLQLIAQPDGRADLSSSRARCGRTVLAGVIAPPALRKAEAE